MLAWSERESSMSLLMGVDLYDFIEFHVACQWELWSMSMAICSFVVVVLLFLFPSLFFLRREIPVSVFVQQANIF